MIYDIYTYDDSGDMAAKSTELYIAEGLEEVLVIRLGPLQDHFQITGKENTGKMLGVQTYKHTVKPVQARHIKLFNGHTGAELASGYVMAKTVYWRVS